jgi:hypothetical protein
LAYRIVDVDVARRSVLLGSSDELKELV